MNLESKIDSVKYDPDVTPAEKIKPYISEKQYGSGSSRGPTRGTKDTDSYSSMPYRVRQDRP